MEKEISTKETTQVGLQTVAYVILIGSGGSIGYDWYEDGTQTVGDRTIEEIAKSLSSDSQIYGIRTFKRLEGEVKVGEQIIKVTSEDFGHSGIYYLGGTVLTREQVEANLELNYLLSSMKYSNCSMVIKNRRCNKWEPFYPEQGDTVLNIP